MTYRLDNIPISEYGALPSPRNANEALAVTGAFSLPKRIGQTERNWGTSIEPYVEKDDIEIDGRTLTFSVLIQADERLLKEKVEKYVNACVACRKLSTDFDDFKVFCREKIEVQEHGTFALVVARFKQPDFVLKPLVKTPSYTGAWQLEEYDLRKDFGIIIAEKSSLESIAKRIESPTTEFYTQTEFRELSTVRINCSMIGSSVADLYDKITQFQALLYKPETRLLKLPYSGQIYFATVYFKDGFSAQIIHENVIKFTLNAVVINVSNIDIWKQLRLTSAGTLRRLNGGSLRFINF